MLSTIFISNVVKATDISSANLVSKGEVTNLLIYKGMHIKTNYVYYTKDGVEYPAYCLNYERPGVTKDLSYSVSVNSAISDVKLWRIIINGYPYKTPAELGCNTKEEAFCATKQAVYCYLIGRDRNGFTGVGEAGTRTVNAIKLILTNAEKCKETQISNNVKIIRNQKMFEVDSKEKEYASKIYSIEAGTTISNYKLELEKLSKDLPEGIKITDINNNEKSEFLPNEKFKILIPIKNMADDNTFKIKVQTKIKNKAVLYGMTTKAGYQDYALTAAMYEDAKGEAEENYFKNETKLKVIKQDQETKKRLANVEFDILDSNQNLLYSNLKTDNNGEIKIENLIPGEYYLKETSTRDGYILNNNVIKFNVKLNEECTITVNNLYKEVQEPEKSKKEISNKVENTKKINGKETFEKEETHELENVKRLPVTGM